MKKFIMIIMGYLFFSLPAIANNGVSTLQLGVNTAYPSTMTTVGEALLYVLAITDYKLAIGYPASTTALEIVERPIPPEAIQHIMPVYQAILLLIGKDSRLVVDTRHKLITIERYLLRVNK
jgi:hypothetical protein